ncbi:hypothetical protein [Thiorhodococcus fuscus]|uniref:DUF4124 domain-containing protein n=1 Tax=Thiorhodococcus fuscus TaxID=527200 RepID=A0ABW4YEA9_9GAMM
MIHIRPTHSPIGLLLIVALAAPGAALAYDNKDAIQSCESRLRSDYGLMDLRESRAEQIPGDKHYRVEGKTKIDGTKYPWRCEVDRRRVVDIRYHGPRPQRPIAGGSTEVRQMASGDLDVRVPGGCRAIYDHRGNLIRHYRNCGTDEMRSADQAIREHLRQNRWDDDRPGRDDREMPPQILPGRHGETRVLFEDDCQVIYDRSGRRTDASPNCRNHQIIQADRAMLRYQRGPRY